MPSATNTGHQTPSGMKIGEVSEATGISIPTLRHYDHVGLVSPSQRTAGGFRLYSELDFRRLKLIRRMKPLGFSLDDMRAYITASETLTAAASSQAAIDAKDVDDAKKVKKNITERALQSYKTLQRKLSYAKEFLADLDATPHSS